MRGMARIAPSTARRMSDFPGRRRASGLARGAAGTGFGAAFFFAIFLNAFLTGFFGLARRDAVFFFFILAMAELRFSGLCAGETLMKAPSASKMDAAL